MLPPPCHHLGDSMPDCDTRLLHLLLREAGRQTDLERGLRRKDLVLGPGGVWGKSFVAGDEDTLDKALDDQIISDEHGTLA